MKRGEIYFIKSHYKEDGSEQKGGRPAVIVSNDKNNENSDVVEIAYMTTKPKADLPTHVFTRSTLFPSTILCEQVYSVSKAKIGKFIGTLTTNEIQSLDTALAISLGIDFGMPAMREPTPEELEKLLEEMRSVSPQPFIQEPDPQNIKLETERDLYKKFSEDLVEILKKGVRP